MGYPVFYPLENDTLIVPFDTFDGGTGASITMTGLAVTDIEIFADGSATTRASDNGYTLLDTDGIDRAGITGIHGFSINLGDNSDAGFFSVGPWYEVQVSAITVDGQTVSFIAAMFRIESVIRGMAGTALPNAVADAIGGLPISDAGGLDMDALAADAARLTPARAGALTDWLEGERLDLLLDAIPTTAMRGTDNAALASVLGTADDTDIATDLANIFTATDRNAFLIESQRSGHTWQGNHFYVDPVNGDTHANGNRGGRSDPYLTIQDCHDNAVTDSNHDVIFLVAGHASTATTHTIAGTTTISKRYVFIRGPGRDFIITRTGAGDTIAVTGDGVCLSGFQLGTAATGSGHGIKITGADFVEVEHIWPLDTQGDGVHILRGSNCIVRANWFQGTGVGGSGQGVHVVGTAGVSTNNLIEENVFSETAGDSILIEQGTTNATVIRHNLIHDSSGWAINIGGSSADAVVYGNVFGNNASGNITDAGTTTIDRNNRDWLSATVEGRTLGVESDGDLTKVNTLDGHTAQTGDNFARIGAAGAGLTGLGGMAAGMKAEVNAEVLDVMNVDTFAEPGQGTPAATASIFTKIGYLYKNWRNKKHQDATTFELLNDDAATVDQKATVSDDGTDLNKGEMGTGP